MKPIVERTHPLGGTQKLYRFTNDLGASVVCTPISYGGDQGLWELAVLRYDGPESTIAYDTLITNDVLGWLSWERVEKVLATIETFCDRRGTEPHYEIEAMKEEWCLTE